MDPSLKENFITTKDAGEISGYSSDYLSRLVRSKKIIGERIGRNWIINKESLTRFLDVQGNHNVDRARTLARERAQEYRVHRSLLHRTTRSLTASAAVSEKFIKSSRVKTNIVQSSFFSHILALSTASLILVFGVVGAQAPILPQLAEHISVIARETASGFNDTFGNIPSHITARVTAADNALYKNIQNVKTANALASARIALPLFSEVDLSSLRMALVDTRSTAHVVSVSTRVLAPDASFATVAVQTFVHDAYTLLSSPSRTTNVLARAYVGIGTRAYAAIGASFAAYDSLIQRTGAKTLASAAHTRDTFVTLPNFIARMNLALGESIVAASHAAIRADVATAYWTASAAPASARTTVALIGKAGNALADTTARVPAFATRAYLRATAVPAFVAPAIAQTVFNAEYAGARRFVAATTAVSNGYLARIKDVGAVTYTFAEHTRSLARTLPDVSGSIYNTYLGILGTSALVLDTTKKAPGLAAAVAALSLGEQAALTTYQTIQGLFDSASGALAAFFTTTPEIILPTGVAKSRVITVATSTRSTTYTSQSNSYPTYTTLVQGVSEDTLVQSLASLRNEMLGTIATQIRPVAAQTVTNASTIQMVNKIERLNGLIVTNGDFRGSIFDSGIRVSATTGTFTNLSGGATSLANTTVSGDLTVSGTITPAIIAATGYISAPYFIATSTTATSTFAGSLNVDSGGFVYATSTRNIGIGVLSPAALLAIQNSNAAQPIFTASNAAGTEVYRLTNAGFVGIGTTSPTYAFAVEGSSSLGNEAIAGYFTATTTTATSTFAGRLGIGTTTPWGDGLFTVGTSSPLLYVSSNSGNIGIGTTSPYASLIIQNSRAEQPIFAAHNFAGTEVYRLTDAGNLGIGTSSPYSKLSVWGSSTGVNRLFELTNSASTTLASILENGTAYFNGNLGIGTTSPYSILSLSNSATTPANTPLFTIASTTGGTSTSTLMTVLANGNVGIGTTSPSAALAVSGNLLLSGTTGAFLTGDGAGITFGGIGNHDITASAGTLRIGSNTIIGNIEALDNTVDIGTSATRFDKIYANEVNATTLVGTLTGGNLIAETFTINSDNLSDDAENAYLAFERGSVSINALLTWNAAESAKRFEFNQPLYINNASASTTLVTLDLKSVAGQIADIFRIASSSSDVLFNVTAAGRVGIGTTSPYSMLSVAGQVVAQNFIATSTTVASSFQNASTTAFTNSGSTWLTGLSASSLIATDANNMLISTSTIGVNNLALAKGNFLVGNDAGVAQATSSIFISSTGNVGISNAVPSARLDIVGDTSVASLGAEMITNSVDQDFTGSSGNWGLGVNWLYGTDNVIHTAGSSTLSLTTGFFSSAPVVEHLYQVTFTINTTAAGSITPSFGGTLGVAVGQLVGADTETQVFAAASTLSGLSFLTSSAWAGTIDDISVMEITPSNATQIVRNSDATIGLEIRSGGSALHNSFVGTNAGKANISGDYNAAFGEDALRSNTTGYYNVASGYRTLYNNTTGDSNTAVGYKALLSNTYGYYNVAIGREALTANTFGDSNVASGYQAMYNNTTGYYNVALGRDALRTNTTGFSNVAIGEGAGYTGANREFQRSTLVGARTNFLGSGAVIDTTALGYRAGYRNNGWDSTFLGGYAGQNVTSGNNNIAIGFNALLPSATASNQMNIGNIIFGTGLTSTSTSASVIPTLTGNIGIGTTSPYSKFSVWGSSTGVNRLFELTNSASTTLASVLENGTTYFAGNLGIGTSTPYSILSISNSASTAANIPLFAIASTTGGTSTSTLMTVLANGNVGIGTTGPVSQLANTASASTDWAGVGIAPKGISWTATTASKYAAVINNSTASGYGVNIYANSSGTEKLLSLSNASADVVNFLANGNVGIGTTTPWAQLSVNPNALGSGVPEFVIGSSTATHFVVTGAGNVGVGKTNPQGRLVVADSGSTLPTSGYGTGLMVARSDGLMGLAIGDYNSGDGSYLQVKNFTNTDTHNLLLQPSGGNVGIGTTSPFANLSIAGAAGGTTNLFAISTSTSGFATSTAFMVNKNGDVFMGLNGSKIGAGTTNVITGAVISFGNLVAGQTALRIPRTDTNPGGFRIDVPSANTYRLAWTDASDALVTGDITGSGGEMTANGVWAFVPTSTGVVPLKARYTTSGQTADMFQINNASDVVLSKFSAEGYLSVNTSVTPVGGVATFNGNVGIGTTSPYSLLSISNSATTAVNTPLFTIASTTAGTATSTLMTVLASGNIGIGTASPGYKLDVNGAIHSNNYIYSENNGANSFVMNSAGTDFGFIQNDAADKWSLGHGTVAATLGTPVLTWTKGGNVGIGTTTPWLSLSLKSTSTSGQFVASYDDNNYSTMAVDATGDLKITAKGGDIRALSENLWICDNAACPTLTATSTAGNIFVENAVTFGNGFSMASTSNNAAAELGLYNSSGQLIVIFDKGL